jgi:hypothetical protein
MNRRLRKLKRRATRQLRRDERAGRISVEDYDKAAFVLSTESGLRQLDAKIREARLNPYESRDNLMAMADWKSVWANIWDWFKANWPAILQFIITIAPLLLDEKENNEDS